MNGYPDDSIYGDTYETYFEKQEDGSWKKTHDELIGLECARGNNLNPDVKKGELCL